MSSVSWRLWVAERSFLSCEAESAVPKRNGDTGDVVSHQLKRILCIASPVVAVVAAVSYTPAATAAASSPARSSDPVAAYNKLSDRANALNERINTANVELAGRQATARHASRDLATARLAEQAALGQESRYLVQVNRFASTSRKGARWNQPSASLTGKSVRDHLDPDLRALSATNFDALNRLNAAVDTARRAERRAQKDLRTAQSATAAASTLTTELTKQRQDLQAQLASLEAAKTKLSARQRASLSSTGVQGTFTAPSGIRGAAMTIALAQRGKPYKWAGAGPNNFDCSGLVLFAYARAGRPGLPHSSAMQARLGVAVSRAHLRPGDLVFFHHPVSHVGIYVGRGLMVDAPHTGAVVRVERLFSGYVGARRLGA